MLEPQVPLCPKEYSPEGYQSKETPMKAYAALIVTYAAVTLARELVLKKKSEEPKALSLGEFFLIAVGSFKLSRVVTLSFIASPLRAPFTKRGKKLSAGEVQDVPRGEGLQHALGDLLTCPFCFNVWAATLLVSAFAFLPRQTVRVASILSAAALGDFLHLGFKFTREEVTS